MKTTLFASTLAEIVKDIRELPDYPTLADFIEETLEPETDYLWVRRSDVSETIFEALIEEFLGSQAFESTFGGIATFNLDSIPRASDTPVDYFEFESEYNKSSATGILYDAYDLNSPEVPRDLFVIIDVRHIPPTDEFEIAS